MAIVVQVWAQPNDVKKLQVTLQITMTHGEWEHLRDELKATDRWPAIRFRRVLLQALDKFAGTVMEREEVTD